jgi:hypothetical protein
VVEAIEERGSVEGLEEGEESGSVEDLEAAGASGDDEKTGDDGYRTLLARTCIDVTGADEFCRFVAFLKVAFYPLKSGFLQGKYGFLPPQKWLKTRSTAVIHQNLRIFGDELVAGLGVDLAA